ncbi:MAG: hypothetical protein ABNH16_03950 [Thalassolituus sp.]|jgi:hypothetical protein|nr:MAG: hypothetical protein COA41_08585 [Sphingopyxis sp.]
MKNLFFCLVLSLFITSCATLRNSTPVLYLEFSQYEISANENNIIELAGNFFSSSLLGNNYQDNPDAASQLLFKNYMLNTDGHFEKINKQEGCLTINGYDEENSPLIFSLKYILSDNQWLIDEIHVVFVENKSDFSSSAKCPSDYPN